VAAPIRPQDQISEREIRRRKILGKLNDRLAKDGWPAKPDTMPHEERGDVDAEEVGAGRPDADGDEHEDENDDEEKSLVLGMCVKGHGSA
jgi:hypothetical protein